MKLYEIANEFMSFMDDIENGLIPEDAINDTLESIELDFSDKVDNIACLIKSMNAECEAIKEEEENLAMRRKTKEKRTENLKNYLSNMMLLVGKDKFESPRNMITFRKSVSVNIEDEKTIDSKYIIEKTERTVDKKGILEALKNGEDIKGARLVEKQNIQLK